MEPRITTLDIRQYRLIRQLRIEELGRVNLLTGRNNTGKSSVLEALRLLSSDAAMSVISDILYLREELTEESGNVPLPSDTEASFTLSSFFHGYPVVSDEPQSVVIESGGGQGAMKLALELGWFSVAPLAAGESRALFHQQRSLFDDDETRPVLVVNSGDSERVVPFDRLRRYRRPFVFHEGRFPCLYVSPTGGEGTAVLGPLWDNVALSDYEPMVIDALRIIEPGISAVTMVGGTGISRRRTAIVRAANLPRPVSLRSFGDGMYRLFGIALSLVNARGGLLLIDEFENGMHHTIQVDAWRTIFLLARRLDVQVFATSHSWDAVEAFQKAASEDPEEGVLVRLSRKGEDIVPTVFREHELAVATREHIEVR